MDNFIIAKSTDVGVARQVNEDSMSVFDSPNGRVMVVCDGMGGQAAGDVASQMAISIIENILTDNTFATPEEAIRSSIMAANQGVLNHAARNPQLEGMGSTCVMIIIKDGRVHCGWVGDSRIYYIANHTIRQISHDQSYVQQLVDSGQISPAEAFNHPQKNEITNCIGLQGMTPPVTLPVPIVPEPGSVFLLCSDGLTGMVDEARIERTISNENLTLQERSDLLINMANQAGGLDNITIELIQFGGADAVVVANDVEATTIATDSKSKKSLYTILSVCVLLLVCSVGVYFLLFSGTSEKSEKKSEKSKERTEQVEKKRTSHERSSTDTHTDTKIKTGATNNTNPITNQGIVNSNNNNVSKVIEKRKSESKQKNEPEVNAPRTDNIPGKVVEEPKYPEPKN